MLSNTSAIFLPANEEVVLELNPLFENRVSLGPGRGHHLPGLEIDKPSLEWFVTVRGSV
jgi:hypothetical protein